MAKKFKLNSISSQNTPEEIKLLKNLIIREYNRQNDVCVGELLADLEVPPGVSFESAFEAYREVMHEIEGDQWIQVASL